MIFGHIYILISIFYDCLVELKGASSATTPATIASTSGASSPNKPSIMKVELPLQQRGPLPLQVQEGEEWAEFLMCKLPQ